MSTGEGISRRQFVRRAALYGGSFWVAVHLPRPRAVAAAEASVQREVFSAEQWRSVEAMAARIIPSDETPGAVEAGCVNFIDKALANEDAAFRPLYDAGLRGLEAVSVERFTTPFASLQSDQQDAVLVLLEDGVAPGWPAGPVSSQQFFEIVRIQTVWGFLADPRHGGNRDYTGWKLVGYPGPRHRGGGYTPEQQRGEAPLPTVWGGKL